MQKHVQPQPQLLRLEIESLDKSEITPLIISELTAAAAPEKGLRDLRLRALEPVALRGSTYLLTARNGERQIFTYLPGPDKVMRVSPESGLDIFNSGLSIKTVLAVFDGLAESAIARGPGSERDGVHLRRLYITPAGDLLDRDFDLGILEVDENRCLPIGVQLQTGGRTTHDVSLRYRQIQDADGSFVSLDEVRIKTPEGPGTVLRVTQHERLAAGDLPRTHFDPERFMRQ